MTHSDYKLLDCIRQGVRARGGESMKSQLSMLWTEAQLKLLRRKWIFERIAVGARYQLTNILENLENVLMVLCLQN